MARTRVYKRWILGEVGAELTAMMDEGRAIVCLVSTENLEDRYLLMVLAIRPVLGERVNEIEIGIVQ